jgi:hypothetical protein
MEPSAGSKYMLKTVEDFCVVSSVSESCKVILRKSFSQSTARENKLLKLIAAVVPKNTWPF